MLFVLCYFIPPYFHRLDVLETCSVESSVGNMNIGLQVKKALIKSKRYKPTANNGA